MRFCMITTFFGRQSFGGDAAYVERLSRALVRRGHEVDVVHCADAFQAVANSHPLRAFEPIDRVRVHTLRSRAGVISPLWSHQTGRLGPKGRSLGKVLSRNFDVLHFHNVSLMGAPQLLRATDRSGRAIRLMTAHEYWLVCPMHSLWKNDREVCERPQCLRCVVRGRRPPQAWRRTDVLRDALEGLDALVCPSRHSAEMHRSRGITRPIVHLPYFLAEDWAGHAPAKPQDDSSPARPYMAAAGRLVRWKGFQELIPLFDRLPHLDLRIAGTGPLERELHHLAATRPNVALLGLLPPAELASLFAGARAVVMPSLGYETFGYVVLEALSVGTPVVVRRRGALTELIDESGGGLTYETDDEAVEALHRIASDDVLRESLVSNGAATLHSQWSEQTQVDAYLDLIERLRAGARPLAAA